ncbi:HAD-IIA family hydrolase [Orrella sp. JC864]|uniref:HAD-IIA family hydrolase n=1 Tax=Orrella sp. JC864 TaxID=3120298 RepID=UPI00300B001C
MTLLPRPDADFFTEPSPPRPRMPAAAHAPARPWRQEAQGLIVDLDGTLMREDEPMAGASELLHAYAGRFVIVSNNSTHTAPQLARRLARAGLPVVPQDLVLAGEQAVRHLARTSLDRRLLLCGSTGLKRLASTLGCRLVERDAEVVLLALDKSFSYRRLAQLTRELAQGAPLVVTNPDLTHPGPDGQIVPETGALLQALRACVQPAHTHVVGKPGRAMFAEAVGRLHAAGAGRLVVIGDNPDTDAAGAVAMGLPYLLVGPGPHADAPDPAGLLALRRPARRGLPGAAMPRQASSA